MFKRFLGVEEYSKLWNQKAIIKINNFIKIRGEIAHNGSKAKYVKFTDLLKYIDLIKDNAIEIDNNISIFLKNSYRVQTTWSDLYYRNLDSYKNKKYNKLSLRALTNSY